MFFPRRVIGISNLPRLRKLLRYISVEIAKVTSRQFGIGVVVELYHTGATLAPPGCLCLRQTAWWREGTPELPLPTNE